MVFGGFDENGNDMYNELSKICMEASLELSLIDPKINLRVGKNTPKERYEYATMLTKKGLGFPQYCNDDVVVPGLIKLGYSKKDACNYTVAACWEYIVPNCSMDIPNICTMNFPLVINRAIVGNLLKCSTFKDLMNCCFEEIKKECAKIEIEAQKKPFSQAPLLSVFVDGCTEALTDAIRHGGKYMNFGCHGAVIANATDALTAIKKVVYDEKIFSPSLDVKSDGLLSVICSFTKYDMTNIINGGPLTIEIHDTVFRNDVGTKKVAALVKKYIDMCGHQLQINSVNREVLLDAQKHPEKYPIL